MMRATLLDLVERWQDAMDRRDHEAYADLYAEDATLDSPLAGSVTGREGVIRVFDAFFAAFPKAIMTPEPPLIDGDRVAIVSAISGTHIGTFLGLPPSGKPFHFPIVFRLDVRDGLILRERRIYDFTGLLLQIGMLTAKPT